jgi:hypothetical protein
MKLEVQFTTLENNWFSRLIRFFQRAPYSHVRLKWVSTNQNIELIYESSKLSTKFIGPLAAQKTKPHVHERFIFELDEHQVYLFETNCFLFAGTDYSYKQLINVWLKRPIFTPDGPSGQICVEIVARLLRSLGFEMDINPETADLNDLYKEMKRITNESKN